MGEPDNFIPPPARDSVPATPMAIAHELEPFIERITVTVLGEFNRQFTDIISILERDRLTTAAAIADIKVTMSQQHNKLLNKLLELEQRQLKAERANVRHSRRIADHEKRIVALEAKRAKRRAHHTR